LRRDDYASKTDPEAQLYRKSKSDAFRMSYLGHVLMENRSGLPVAARVTDARPQGEWEAALEMAAACQRRKQITVAGDKAYDDAEFVRRARELGITPHVQKNEHERHHSNLDGRTTRHPGYSISLQKRKRIEHIFAWLKTTALMRKVRHPRSCSRRVDVHAGSERIQSRAVEPTGSSARITQGRSMPGRVENGPLRPVPPYTPYQKTP